MQETQETWVQSLGGEDPLEEGMATHFSVLAWRIAMTEKPGGLQSLGSERVIHDSSDLAHTHVSFYVVLRPTERMGFGCIQERTKVYAH